MQAETLIERDGKPCDPGTSWCSGRYTSKRGAQYFKLSLAAVKAEELVDALADTPPEV